MPEDETIRPFTVGFPDAELTDLRSRVSATRWPEVETVADDSQGAPLAMYLRQVKVRPSGDHPVGTTLIVAAGHAGHPAAMASEAGPLTVNLSTSERSGRTDQRGPTGSMTTVGRP